MHRDPYHKRDRHVASIRCQAKPSVHLQAIADHSAAEDYDEVEVPLAKILSRVECQGVRVDEGRLDDLSEEYRGRLAEIKREIYQQAGEEFLISSPKQLQRILFEKLNFGVSLLLHKLSFCKFCKF